MAKKPSPKRRGKRDRVLISKADQKRILSALESWASDGDFIALRTRAFVYLLWDGAARTKVARYLDAEEVVQDPDASRITVVQEVAQRPCEANKHEGKRFVMSKRTRKALTEYLRAVRRDGLLPTRRLEGPLFLSNRRKRISREMLILSWKSFMADRAKTSREYQLDDVVYTGRMDFLGAAEGDSDALSEHSGIGRRWAAEYREGPGVSPTDVMAKLNKQQG